MQELILVNNMDEPIGSMEKMEVHRKGLLHRAFSIFIFNSNGEILLQQRAENKYHSAGLWTNTCCSHPLPGETNLVAAHRRLNEELGFDTDLLPAFEFIYREEVGNGLTEHEYDHVLTGLYDGAINPNEQEVQDYCYMHPAAIRKGIEEYPHIYTAWFKIAFPKLEEYLATNKA